jgi:hypothetical protein
MSIGIFGPGVIGQVQFDAEQKIVKAEAVVYGPAVTGIDMKAELAAAHSALDNAYGAAGADNQMSAKEVAAALTRNPALVDELLESELARNDVRKTVLRALLEAELQREGGPRAEITGKVEHALKELSNV